MEMESRSEKKYKESEWNGIYCTFTLVVDILVAISFCTAVTEDSLGSVVVLFGLTYLASFFEQRKNFYEKQKEIESHLASIGCGISILLLTACTMIGIGFAEVHIQVGHVPKILLLSGENSIFYWGSINITYITFVLLFYPMIIHILIEIVGVLKAKEIRVYEIIKYLGKHWLIVIQFGVVFGAIGIIACCVKYYILNMCNGLGNYQGMPQYHKYAIILGSIGFLLGIGYCVRKNIKEQRMKGERR